MVNIKVLEGAEDITGKVLGKDGNELVGKDGKPLVTENEVIDLTGKSMGKKSDNMVGENGRPLVKVADMGTRVRAIITELANLIADEMILPVKYIEQADNGVVGYIVRENLIAVPIGQPDAPESIPLNELGMLDLVLIFESAEPTNEVEIMELTEYNDILRKEVKNKERNKRKQSKKK